MDVDETIVTHVSTTNLLPLDKEGLRRLRLSYSSAIGGNNHPQISLAEQDVDNFWDSFPNSIISYEEAEDTSVGIKAWKTVSPMVIGRMPSDQARVKSESRRVIRPTGRTIGRMARESNKRTFVRWFCFLVILFMTIFPFRVIFPIKFPIRTIFPCPTIFSILTILSIFPFDDLLAPTEINIHNFWI